jgi:hypothetical protein
MTGAPQKDVVRIAMWSGPRNISTALMRAFENRPDCAVTDEPFYAAYLALSGIDHPMREEVLESQPTDWRTVADALAGPAPEGRPIWYQKHMTHHMLPEIGRDWVALCRNVFLIRHPARVLASYARKRAEVTLDDIGFVQQEALYDHALALSDGPPPVIDADDLLQDPAGLLRALCRRLGIPFSTAMLSWPAGGRDSDGVWAAHWYDAVRRSTGFEKPRPQPDLADPVLRAIEKEALPVYSRLREQALAAE